MTFLRPCYPCLCSPLPPLGPGLQALCSASPFLGPLPLLGSLMTSSHPDMCVMESKSNSCSFGTYSLVPLVQTTASHSNKDVSVLVTPQFALCTQRICL